MYYIIKKETNENLLDNSFEIKLSNNNYEVIKSFKNSGLELISDFIVEGDVLVKSDIRLEKEFREVYEKEYGPLKEILLG